MPRRPPPIRDGVLEETSSRNVVASPSSALGAAVVTNPITVPQSRLG
jgi:hypothetical protein